MLTIPFTGTSLSVSPIALGTVNYGTRMSEADSFRQMDIYSERGNFLDTAHVYGCSADGAFISESERVIGRWLKSRGMAGKVVISSKGGHPPLTGEFKARLSRGEIMKDLNESLTLLNVDAIDMYFLHRDDTSIPVGEILETLEGARKDGKIRFYGVSNWTLPRLQEAQAYAAAHGMAGFSANQIKWSLAHVNAEMVADKTLVNMDGAFYRYHSQTGLPVMAYTSVAKGYFSRRAAGIPVRERLLPIYTSAANDEIFAFLLSLSEESGISVTELTFMYFFAQPFASVAIASFSSETQMLEGLSALEHAQEKSLISRLHSLRRDLIGG